MSLEMVGTTVPPDLYITQELGSRAVKKPDYQAEKRALQNLAVMMADDPEQVLPRFVELAMKMTGGISSGLSLYEQNPAPGVFRWKYLSGSLASFEDALTPRNFSPCGITMDEDGPVLSRHPERHYDWISDAGIVVPEVLLVPLHFGGQAPMGTLWIVASTEGHFDSGDARIATELATFAAIALRMLRTEQRLQKAFEEQETVSLEMGHRVKNLFTIAGSLVQLTARHSDSKEDMTRSLMTRFGALASAHGLVRRNFLLNERGVEAQNLEEVMRAILAPYDGTAAASRFGFSGPAIELGEHALNGVALIVNELTTNAVKYGALAGDCGRIAINWQVEAENLLLDWVERDGPPIARPPEVLGFGSKLLRDTVTRQFQGALEHDWGSDGLSVRLRLPLASLAA